MNCQLLLRPNMNCLANRKSLKYFKQKLLPGHKAKPISLLGKSNFSTDSELRLITFCTYQSKSKSCPELVQSEFLAF